MTQALMLTSNNEKQALDYLKDKKKSEKDEEKKDNENMKEENEIQI